MKFNFSAMSKGINQYIISGVLVGVVGFLYYANFRQVPIYLDYNPLFSLFKFTDEAIQLPRYIDEWIPSFLHVIGMSLFTFGLLVGLSERNKNTKRSIHPRLYLYVPLAWLVIDLLFEFLQAGKDTHLLAAGNFEWVDIVAMILGTAISVGILARAQSSSEGKITEKGKFDNTLLSNGQKNIKPNVAIVSSLLLGSYLMLGSYVVLEDEITTCQFPNGDTSTDCFVEPIYMPLQQIRSSHRVVVSPELELGNLNLLTQEFYGVTNAGKLYVYGDLLFINERLRGTYIFDNSIPSSPRYLGFISVQGNQDVVVYNDILYLDSFSDIVSIDLGVFKNLSSGDQVITETEVYMHINRDIVNLPDTEGFLPEGVSFTGLLYTFDDVLIGYKNYRGDKFYFWELGLTQ